MWLTSREICHELHISSERLTRLRLRGKIRFLRLGNVYRYELPKPGQLFDPVPSIERVAFFSYSEAALVLGISRIRVRVGVHEGIYHPITVGKRRYFTLYELRRILADREGRSGQAKQHVSRTVVEWARHYIEKDSTPVQVLESLLKTAADHLEEPARSEAISRLWKLFDEVDDLIRAVKKPRSAVSAGR